MKANENTVLEGRKVVLVPYGKHHVPKYHEWMQNEELRELTASEPLSLEEEFSMQEKWQIDEDKLTFIILAPNHPPSGGEAHKVCLNLLGPSDPKLESMPMIGDVNLFLKGSRRDNRQDVDVEDDFEAEVEIMIAEPDFRRKGLAIEALQLMLGYATTGSPSGVFPASSEPEPQHTLHHRSESPLPVPPRSLVTRISESNTPSIKLFEKLGFAITKRVEVFREVEMRYQG
ncbi:acetyltransferase family protein [Pleurotus pulmonarius]